MDYWGATVAIVVRMTRRVAVPFAVLMIVAVLVVVPLTGPARAVDTRGAATSAANSAAGAGAVVLDAAVNNVSVSGRRIVLDPGQPTHVVVAVRNNRNELAQIRSIRVSGSTLGLTFFVFDTAVKMDVPAGTSVTWEVDVDMAELRGQATGLLSMQVALRDATRTVVASASGIVDVHGSLVSTYGMFGLGLLLVTIFLWAAALLALARHRLPRDRWRRAVRFAPAGCGIGFVAVVSLSALRITPPSASSDLTFIAGAAGIGFLLGYLTPSPARSTSVPQSPTFPESPPAPADPDQWFPDDRSGITDRVWDHEPGVHYGEPS